MTERAQISSKATVWAQSFTVFSLVQMQDNWWHCRSYLAILRGLCKGSNTDLANIKETEELLAMLFAVIRSAAPDPLPWLPVIDHVLRNFWRSIESQEVDKLFVKEVFNELALFAHGTALCAFMARCKVSSRNTDRILVRTFYPHVFFRMMAN